MVTSRQNSVVITAEFVHLPQRRERPNRSGDRLRSGLVRWSILKLRKKG